MTTNDHGATAPELRPPAGSDLKTQIILLVALVLVLTLQPVAGLLIPLGGIAMQVAFLAVLVFGANAGHSSRRLRLVVRSAAGAAFLAGTLAQFYPIFWLGILTSVLYTLVFGLVTARLLSFVLGDSGVNVSKLCGSVSAYLMIGVAWGIVYKLVDLIAAGSFLTQKDSPPEAHDLVYFSLVTLSTLGYGDIVPVTRAARTLATFEAMFGQMYLAILVARLVGLSAARHGSNRKDS